MPNVRSIPSTITEIALIQFSLVVLKGPSICRQNAIGPKGEVSGDGLESSRQGCHMETLQVANCYIGISLDPSKPKGMPLGPKLHSALASYSFITKYIYKAKA